MAKPARNNQGVDPFDAFLQQEAEGLLPQQPDEFTVRDYVDKLAEKGIKMTIAGAHSRLQRLRDEGALTARTGRHNGNVSLFFKVKPEKK